MVLPLKKFLACLLTACLLGPAPAAQAADAATKIQALSAVLMSEGGQLLFEQEPDRMLPIASTTKLMTALVVLENCPLDRDVEIPADCCGIEGSSMYLRPGEHYSVRELLTGLLLASGNDAACALACCCAGDVESFGEMMNRRAKEIGMRNSHFLNPHGLNEAGHYSTARDMALLMREAMNNESFAALIAQRSAVVGGQTLYNHNKLLDRCEGCLGGKTGFTQVAGRCLVSCVERGGTRYFCVTLADPEDWLDHEKLYDWAYASYEERVLSAETLQFEVPVLSGDRTQVQAVPAKTLRVLAARDVQIELRAELPFYVFAPVAAGASAGTMRVCAGDELIAEIPLVYAEAVSVP